MNTLFGTLYSRSKTVGNDQMGVVTLSLPSDEGPDVRGTDAQDRVLFRASLRRRTGDALP